MAAAAENAGGATLFLSALSSPHEAVRVADRQSSVAPLSLALRSYLILFSQHAQSLFLTHTLRESTPLPRDSTPPPCESTESVPHRCACAPSVPSRPSSSGVPHCIARGAGGGQLASALRSPGGRSPLPPDRTQLDSRSGPTSSPPPARR
eukprot:354246-Prorocentrum_minimum.AAC.1